MTKDPVCGMEVNERDSKHKINHEGKDYHFCSPGCQEQFRRKPQQFAGQSQEPRQGEKKYGT